MPEADRPIDARFARLIAGADFKSEANAKEQLEEAEVDAARTLVDLLDASVPPSTRFSAARYILELNGHTPGAQKTKDGTTALIERLTRPGPTEEDIEEVSPEAKKILADAQKQAETLAAKRKGKSGPVEPPVELEERGALPEISEFPEVEG